MVDISTADFFSDPTLADDPYPYFDELRSRCPVHPIGMPRVMAVTGYEEAIEVYRDAEVFSACNSVAGPFPPLEGLPAGDDISDYVEQNREHWFFFEYLITMDGEAHEKERGLLRRIMTPRRLRENVEAMSAIADQCLLEGVSSGASEVVGDFARPFTTLVIADLLGMPDEDRVNLRMSNFKAKVVGALGSSETIETNLLQYCEERFLEYVIDRRANPRDDVLTQLANATYPDGSIPEPDVVVRLASFLFGAGQDTTARLIGSALRIIAEDQGLQAKLRADNKLIPAFIEETLRLESPTKSDFRYTKSAVNLGGVDVPPGTTVMVHPGACNRDDRKFENPDEFDLDRENNNQHIAFGRGAHTCPGAPLARAEATITVERYLASSGNISINEEKHGPAEGRTYSYEKTFLLRGLSELHLLFTPPAQ
ncbi:cytochrome P450 [Nocardia sp. 348MFTsu5.1]|uniref:cytochrome P450 n=1 Tax=Nocardia sp. 348MFTsu5.1 TaxID=1172185 RepID=UPI00036693E3|nr:cytochrome P450 [Nocardia sp. 348MFTsu5.1]